MIIQEGNWVSRGLQDEIKTTQSLQNRHTRLVIITLPLLLEDKVLTQIKLDLKINQIEAQFLPRQPQVTQNRALSIVHLLPKLPYNICNQEQLDKYLLESSFKLQDPLNIVFLFYGISLEGERKSISQIESVQIIQQNPQSSQISVQFITTKLKDRAISVQRQRLKFQAYYDEIVNTFPDRTIKVDLQEDLQMILSGLYQKFEWSQSTIEEQQEQNIHHSHFDEDDVDDNDKDIDSQKGFNQDQINLQQMSSVQQPSLNLVIIFPLLIPCCGKTLIEKCLSTTIQKWGKYICVSSDQITSGLMQDDDNQSLQAQYSKVQCQQKKKFQQHLFETIKQLIPSQNNSQQVVIFLDRNCPPNTLMSTIDQIKVIQNELQPICSIRVKNLGIFLPNVDVSQQPTEIPLSYDQIITLLKRVFHREGHETLQDDPVLKAKVVTKYVSLYRNVKTKQTTLRKLGLHSCVQLDQFPDIINSQGKQFQRLILLLDEVKIIFKLECLKSSRVNRDLGEGECFSELVSEYFKQFQNDNDQMTNDEIMQSNQSNSDKISQSARELFKQF